MNIQPSDSMQGGAQRFTQHNPKLADIIAEQFKHSLNSAQTLAGIHAAEDNHKTNLRKNKDHVEDGKNMGPLDEEDLQDDLDALKRKMRNVLNQERRQIGL